MVTVNGYDGNAFDQRSILAEGGRFIKTTHKFVLSGNYATGGDTLDWTNGGVNSAVPPAQSQGSAGPAFTQVNDNGPVGGILQNGGYYTLIPGSGLNNWKLKVWKNTAGSVAEYSAGAYAADVLTDTLIVVAWWPR